MTSECTGIIQGITETAAKILPVDVLKLIAFYHSMFYERDIQERTEYHEYLNERRLRCRNERAMTLFIMTIRSFSRTRRTIHLVHPISQTRKRCEICSLIPVGGVFMCWNENIEKHRPCTRRNGKRAGRRQEICFECSTGRGCITCSSDVTPRKTVVIPVLGETECVLCRWGRKKTSGNCTTNFLCL